MNTKIKAPFFKFCSIISLFSNNKLTSMHELEKQSVAKAKVKLYPTFHIKAPIVQAMDNAEAATQAIRRMAARTYTKMAESKRGKKLITKAGKYSIPYNPNDVDWLKLISQIEEYETLLTQAKEYHIKVDTKFYDPLAIKESIEECVFESRREARDLNSYYHSTRV